MDREPDREGTERHDAAGDSPASAGIPERPPQPLLSSDVLPGWQMERDLRIARAAQLSWMVELRREYVREADQHSQEILESAIRREASQTRIDIIKGTALHRAQEAGRAAEMHIAQAVGRSEYVVASEINAAERVQSKMPRVWRAFTTGRICDLRLRKIAATLEKLRTAEAVEKLDEQAAEYAETHRLGQVKDWLKGFEHTAEPAHAAERFAAAARQRRVTVTEVEDGMSLLSALLPSLTAHALKRRLDAAARSATEHIPHNPLIAEHTLELQHRDSDSQLARLAAGSAVVPEEFASPGVSAGFSIGSESQVGRLRVPTLHIIDGSSADPASAEEPDPPASQPQTFQELPATREDGDPRSMDQRAADAFCAWLLNTQTPDELSTAAQIEILVEEATLTGVSDQPGFTRDGKIPVPARNLRDWLRAQTEQLSWYQLLHPPPEDRPSGENLLAVHAEGRYPPERLRVALWFRDRTCSAPGCNVPAEHCDIDHIIPWPEGETNAENLELLCRRHHRLKSWGYDVHLPSFTADLVFAA